MDQHRKTQQGVYCPSNSFKLSNPAVFIGTEPKRGGEGDGETAEDLGLCLGPTVGSTVVHSYFSSTILSSFWHALRYIILKTIL